MLEIKNEEELRKALEGNKKDRLDYTFKCLNCGKAVQNSNTKIALRLRLYRVGYETFLLCRSCAIKIGTSKRSEEDKEAAKAKRKQTNLKKYGTENPFKDTEKMKQLRKDKLGVENVSQLDSVKEKKKQNSLKKFGTENPAQSAEVQNKIRATNLKKLGVENPLASKAVQDRIKQTNRNRFGYDYHTQSPEFREHLRAVWQDKKKRAELSKKVSKTWAQKTAEEIRLIRSKAHKVYEYQDEFFDSSWELAVWIWAKDKGKNIIREPICIEYDFKGTKHKYFPDFEIDEKLIEVKGDHFFNAKGEMICPWDSSRNEIYQAKHLAALEAGVEFWKNDKIKGIVEYVDQTYTEDYLKLFEVKKEFPFEESVGRTDLQTIRYFHRSLYSANKKGKLSPFEAWQNKKLVEQSAKNRLKYVGNCKPESIVRGFSVAQIAPRVSVFKPSTAERLIKVYLNEFSEIFDPFSGFSGRLLGTVRCGKRYVGQDINEAHVKESNEIIRFKQLPDCSVTQQDVLTDVKQKHECLFTCPPYGGKEHWNENNDEVEKSCDEWIDVCLEKYKCKRYLFVIDKTEKYKDFVVETLHTKTLYGLREELVVCISQ